MKFLKTQPRKRLLEDTDLAKPIAIAGASPAPIAYASNPTVVILNGSGTPGTGGTSIAGYTWVTLDQPDAVIFDNVNIYNPTVSNLPTEGTVLLFLKVTDNLGAVSEEDPLQAPDSAFYRISIKSQNIDIEKPAAGQRNWEPAYTDAVDKIDAFKAEFDAHTIYSHDTFATGAQLTTLTGGGSAAGLHTHPASDITTFAAVGTAGKVELAEAPADAGHPKAVTRDKFVLCGTYTGTLAIESGNASWSQLAWRIYADCKLSAVGGGLRDGGSIAGANTIVTVYKMTAAQYTANDAGAYAAATAIGTYNLGKVTADNFPLLPTTTDWSVLANTDLVAGDVIAVRVTSLPTTPSADLHMEIHLEKRW